MSANTANYNYTASVASAQLTLVLKRLDAVEKRIATGYSIADAFDNGAIFSIAQTIRSDIAGARAANTGLSIASGLVDTTNTALLTISNLFSNPVKGLGQLLTQAENQTLTSQFATIRAEVAAIVTAAQSYLAGAIYNGTSLTTNVGATSFTQVVAVLNAEGATSDLLNNAGFSTYLQSVVQLIGYIGGIVNTQSAASAQVSLQNAIASLGSALAILGDAHQRIVSQISFNTTHVDAYDSGLQALIEADLDKASTEQALLTTQRRLATESLVIANRNPDLLLGLFQQVAASRVAPTANASTTGSGRSASGALGGYGQNAGAPGTPILGNGIRS